MAWNRPTEQPHAAKRKSSARWPLIVVVGIAVALIGVFLLMESKSDDIRHEKKGSRTSKASETRRTTAKQQKAANVPSLTSRVDKAVATLGEFARPEVVKSTYANRTFPPPVKQTFSSGTEQMMSWIFTCPVGQMPMPIPPLTENERKELASVLISKNEITDSDDELAKHCKETVDFVKKELTKYIKDGGDPDDFLQYYYQELESAFQYREAARLQGYDLAEEDPQLGREFLHKVNEKLREQGIMELSHDDFGLPAEDTNEVIDSES